jgi:predicted amidohydrolase
MGLSPVSTLRVAAVPFDARCGDAPHNVAQIVATLERAAAYGIRLAVFPEASVSGVSIGARERRAQLDVLAEPFEGASIAAVAQAVERTGVAAGIGWLERGIDGRLFNSYAVCMPDGRRVRHRQLVSAGHRSIAGGATFTVFDTGWGIHAGILVGADNHASENARMTALMGANLLIAPYRANRVTQAKVSGGADTRQLLSRTWPGRALDNGTFVVFSDGGDDEADGAQPRGMAMIVDPHGRLLADNGQSAYAGTSADAPFVCAELDLALARENIGRHWRATRRPALYRGLADAAAEVVVPPERRAVTSRGSLALSVAVVRRTPPVA